MNNELRKKIQSDIIKSGFLAELHVASIFVKDGWEVRNAATYLDKDDGISREIDIIAFTCISKGVRKIKDIKKISVRLTLVIEVKTSRNRPWIIFTVPIKDSPFLGPPGWGMIHYTDDFDSNTLPYEDIVKNSVREDELRIGISFNEAFKSPAEPSQIYKALVTSCKAAMSQLEPILQEEKQSSESKYPFEIAAIDFFQPVVVLDGILTEATLNHKGEIRIREKDYIPIVLSSFSPKYGDGEFFPDLVTIKGLPSYINCIKKWIGSIEHCLLDNLLKKNSSGSDKNPP